MQRSSAGDHPDGTPMSLLKIPTTPPRLARIPWFQALAHPRLVVLRMTVTPSIPFRYSGVLSVEALSTMMISSTLLGRRRMDSKHRIVWTSWLYTAMTRLTRDNGIIPTPKKGVTFPFPEANHTLQSAYPSWPPP